MRRGLAIGIVAWLIISLGGAARGEETIRLESADTALVIKTNSTGVEYTYLGRPGNGWNWLSKTQAFQPGVKQESDHQFSEIDWKLGEIKKESLESASHVSVRFTAEKPALEMIVVWTAHPGPGPIEQTIVLKNVGTMPVRISGMPSLSLKLEPPPQAKLQYAWVEKGATKPSPEGTHRLSVGEDFHERQFSTPWVAEKKKPSYEAIPWLGLVDLAGGEGLYAVISSSAYVSQQVDRSPGSKAIEVTLGLDERVAPMIHELQPGGTLKLPPTMIGCFKGSLDDGCNRLHRWAERWHAPRTTDERFPLLANCTWGRSYKIDEASCFKMIDDAAELGIDIFHVDAGWYQAVGLWRPNPKKFPRGISPISDHAHEKGMKFGLWVAWAQGGDTPPGKNALSLFDPTMREWFAVDKPANWKARSLNGQTVCLGSSAARDWCVQELERIITEYHVDMLEHDQQMIVRECERPGHDHTNSAVDASLASAAGYAEVYSELRHKFPNLILENCVDGGATVDYAMMGLCDYVSITDTYDPLSNRQAFYDASFPLPPRMLECYIGKHPGKSLDQFRYTLRSGMMGWCSVMIDTTEWNAAEHATARRQFDIYKQKLRPLIREGDLYHLTDRPRDDSWDAMEYVSPDRARGAVCVFRGKADEEKRHTFSIRGLTPSAKYEVTFEDHPERKETLTGEVLMAGGLAVDLPDQETSEIVWVTKVE